MDTTASAISRILWILAQRQDAQDKICTEMRNARKEKGDRDLTYDELVALPYLDAVCKETLRLSVCLLFFFSAIS
jgi:cytochrome P450